MSKPAPPYVRFETRAIELQKPAIDGGGIFYKDVDFALLTQQGSKDVTEKVVEDWLTNLKESVRQDRFPAEWYQEYKAAYTSWKEDHSVPLNGESIMNWPIVGKSQVKILLDWHIRTVEDVAAMNEEALSHIGMGARDLKQKAADWLEAKNGTAPLVQQLDALRGTVRGLQLALEAKDKQIEQLFGRITQATNAAASFEAQTPAFMGYHRQEAERVPDIEPDILGALEEVGTLQEI